MKNTDPNHQAFPCPPYELSDGYISMKDSGLSKREYFAAMAMQGIITTNGTDQGIEDDCILSLKYADALINELNK